jgi:hypothetical protein
MPYSLLFLGPNKGIGIADQGLYCRTDSVQMDSVVKTYKRYSINNYYNASNNNNNDKINAILIY